ncbi:uncharacterized protein LOC62_01G001596 [Vanrija pseudolonga]|uniref:Uncharacterized protein n=1 Tax=Vanrija pseudolonga TaxID=143232 RepID=A0AAF1BNF5_9TREE|nr:hypothetical protein LOC62_01G001596 [Vanrija pseudolonga]
MDIDEPHVLPASTSHFLSLAELSVSLPAVQTPAATSHGAALSDLGLQHLPAARRQAFPTTTTTTVPTAQAPTPALLPLNYDSYPHLVELVAAHADLPVLLAFRATSRGVRAKVDAMLAQCISPTEDGARGARFMRPVPKLDGHTRALLPPYTVVDRLSVHSTDAAFRIAVPPKTERHVVVLECDAHSPPIPRSMSVSPEIRHFDLVRPLASARQAEGPYPPVLDLVFAADSLALLGHLTRQHCTTGPTRAPDTGGLDEDVFEFEADLAYRYLHLFDPALPGFFGHVVRYLSVAQRLLAGCETVRIWGLKSLSPPLVKRSLSPSASSEEVTAAAVEIVRNRILFHRAFFTPGTDVDVCLSRLEVHEDDL